MKIAVMGTGAMGGYVGARLAEAGADVTFIARGPHLAAMRQDGLKVTSPEGDIHINPASATDDPAEVGPMDLILLGVKLFDVEKAVSDLRPMLGPDTGVISLQNGIDTPGVVSRIAGPQHSIPGIAMINGEIAAPGLIQHNAMNDLIVGEPDGRASPRMAALEALGEKSALNLVISPDIEAQLWRKVLALTPTAGLSCLTRLPLGQVRETPASWDLLQQAMGEVVAVAQAEGVGLGDIDIQNASASVREFMPPTWRGSLVTDLEAGRRLEVEWLHGAICRLGEKHGIDTPFHRVVLGALMPHANGAA
ncbi:MAG: 2-dehydropantoate 2-reductase [Alphaproteobacteria bacterium]|jgi:2-dehydropantoate 2-reductase|nr:2-dehydropantoate 2-reductase [Alphaproteobacteria bacterium]